MSFNKFKKKKEKENKMSNKVGPGQLSPKAFNLDKRQFLVQLNEQYQKLRQDITNTQNQYAASFMNIANDVGKQFFKDGTPAQDAVEKGFEYAAAFEAISNDKLLEFASRARVNSHLIEQYEQIESTIATIKDELELEENTPPTGIAVSTISSDDIIDKVVAGNFPNKQSSQPEAV